MSDDEDYYDDYEIIWIEDAEPGIADDLAEAAHHDPVLIDDPSFDVEDYFSDWDDMSDEYYDDEPTILKRRRMALKMAESESAHQEPTKPGSKKNTSQTRKGPKSRPGRGTRLAEAIDSTSFQSVVWKLQEQEQQPKLHLPGEGEKVALLKNWREVFKSSHPSVDRSRWRIKPPVTTVRSGAMDDSREDSSGRTSRAPSLENLREIETIDSIDASNTTPTKSESPRIAEGYAEDEEMVDAPPARQLAKPTSSPNVLVEITVPTKEIPPQEETSLQKEASPPRKRGRKRKAEALPAPTPAPVPAPTEEIQGGIGNTNKRPRSTKNTRSAGNASKSAGKAGASSSQIAPPVRRSTRQK